MKARHASLALVVVCASSRPSQGESALPTDVRLQRAVTLDDYHPWAPITDPKAWEARAARVRRQILVAAGLWPMPVSRPLRPTIHGKIERDAYTIEKVYFESYPGFFVTGNLYRPTAGPAERRPGVLCPHGHWENGRFYEDSEADARREIEKGAEKTIEGARYPLQARCAMLARMGCVVFHYDMVGMADSKQLPHGAGFGDTEAELRLQSAFGLQLYNSIRSLDFITSLPDVDPRRIGVTGASGGGTQTFFLCGVDPRPAVAFPAVMVSTAMQGGCVCENASILRVGTGNIEFAALMAPRPLGMTGANDWTLEIETKGLPELKALYSALGVPSLVDAKCFPRFDHNYNQVSRERMYEWMRRHLRLSWPEPVEEKPFVPVPPAELSVFDAEHPQPAGAVDLAGLRRTLTEMSEASLRALLPRDRESLAAYRDVVVGALGAIITSEVPSRDEVRGTVGEEHTADGIRRRSMTLGRVGTGEQVPVTWIEPAGAAGASLWSGQIILVVGDDASLEAAGFRGAAAPAGLAARALSRGAAVLVPEVFLTGRLVPEGGHRTAPVDPERHAKYCGYTFGYNRTPLANRVHDVLTALGYARGIPGARKVHLVGLGEGGLWVLLAKAIAGADAGTTLAAKPSFDFSDVAGVDDLRFLPGGLKYGGWGGFAAAAAPEELVLLGDGDLPAILGDAYRAAGVAGRLRLVPPAEIAAVLDRCLEGASSSGPAD